MGICLSLKDSRPVIGTLTVVIYPYIIFSTKRTRYFYWINKLVRCPLLLVAIEYTYNQIDW